jgi:hypothetical protein
MATFGAINDETSAFQSRNHVSRGDLWKLAHDRDFATPF